MITALPGIITKYISEVTGHEQGDCELLVSNYKAITVTYIGRPGLLLVTLRALK